MLMRFIWSCQVLLCRSALEVVLGVKAAWELASSGANERVTGWDAGTVEADAAAGGAGDTMLVDLAGGLGPSTAL